LYAKTPTCPNANYTIELQTTDGTHIKTITGSTSSGEISEFWNLTDDNGSVITNDSVNAVFNVTLLDPGSYSQTLNLIRLASQSVPDDGNFTVAYAWDNNYEAANDLRDCFQYGIVDQLLMPCNISFCYDYPYSSTFNDWTGNSTPQGKPGYLPDKSSVTNLLNNLGNVNIFTALTKNFFFFGHGSSTALGDGKKPDPTVNIDYTQVANALGNYSFVNSTRGKSSSINYFPNTAYRFAFLDACDTADDADWSHTFGIHDRITSAQLSYWPERAQAFVGWNGEQKVPDSGNMSDMDNAFSVFFSAWQSGLSLDDCIYYASQYLPPDPFSGYNLPWNFGSSVQHYNTIQQWYYGINNPNPRLVIYGYAGLTRTGYEPGHDNSPYYKK
jgi:hypothetical protein